MIDQFTIAMMNLESKLMFGSGEGPAICLEMVEVISRIRSLQLLRGVPIADEKSLGRLSKEQLASWEEHLQSEVSKETP
jgi:hypothetical protein